MRLSHSACIWEDSALVGQFRLLQTGEGPVSLAATQKLLISEVEEVELWASPVWPHWERTQGGRAIPAGAATGFFVLLCLLTEGRGGGGSEGRIDRGSHCAALTLTTQSCVQVIYTLWSASHLQHNTVDFQSNTVRLMFCSDLVCLFLNKVGASDAGIPHTARRDVVPFIYRYKQQQHIYCSLLFAAIDFSAKAANQTPT